MADAAPKSNVGLQIAILVIASVWVVGRVIFTLYASPATQLLSGLVFLAYLVAVVVSIAALVTGWRRLTWRAAVPLLICSAGWYGARFASDMAADVLFARNLPAYEAMVARPDVQAVVAGTGLQQLTLHESDRSLFWWAGAERTPDGTLMVELVNGSGFPVKHSGFLYTSSGSIPEGSRMNSRWPYRCSMRAHWFCVSD